jgi:hypothetical protein
MTHASRNHKRTRHTSEQGSLENSARERAKIIREQKKAASRRDQRTYESSEQSEPENRIIKRAECEREQA